MDIMGEKILSLVEKQKISLDILKYVSNFCAEHNIRYYLAYGTLLGAIRHKGFIPWDDDVDIQIPRPDYEKFLKEFTDTSDYELLTCFKTRDYILPYAKVSSKNTKMLLPSGKIINQGIGIDLFPLDGIPNDMSYETANDIFSKHNNTYIKMIQNIGFCKYFQPITAKEYIKKGMQWIGEKTNIIQKTARKLSYDPFGVGYEQCEKIAIAVAVNSGLFCVFNKEWFVQNEVDFENAKFYAPSGYGEILTMLYNDYMKLPPEQERQTTHLIKYIWDKV